MRSIRRVALVLALLLAGCGGDDDPGASVKATPTSTPSAAPTPATITCDEAAYTPKPGKTYAHPSENFYPPDYANAPTAADLEHLLAADNAIVVTYPANTPAEALERLKTWSGAQTASVVLIDPAPDAPPLQAKIANAKLTCDGVDEGQLQSFADKRGDEPAQPHDEG
jgi:hypothetical protein